MHSSYNHTQRGAATVRAEIHPAVMAPSARDARLDQMISELRVVSDKANDLRTCAPNAEPLADCGE